jgi:NADPH-dependent F420 reductase
VRIAILGAGNVGGQLARAGVQAGHQVVLSSRRAEQAAGVADSVGATAAPSNRDAVRDADLVVLAVPHSAAAAVADELSGALDGKVVVDSTNPLNDTFTDLTTSGTSAAEDLQRKLPNAAVVKAFNTILAGRLSDPVEGGAPLDAFLAGDDAEGKASVARFAESLGYHPIDAGGLRMARALEEMAFLNISLNATNGWPWQSGWKLVGPTG